MIVCSDPDCRNASVPTVRVAYSFTLWLEAAATWLRHPAAEPMVAVSPL